MSSELGTRDDAVRRRSPIRLDATPDRVELRDGWRVVLEYDDRGAGTMLVDLSHRARWDVQDGAIDELRPFGVAVPRDPGDVAIASGLMINRMNRTQASVWHIGPGPTPATPDDVAVTDTTDANAWIAIVGDAVAGVMEHVTSLDLFEPGRSLPRLIQGPVLGVPCQVVVGSRTGALLTFARGYAQSFVDALLDSAAPAGLGTGGERVFSEHVAAMARGG